MATSETNLHLEEEREKETAWYARLERQAPSGGHENDSGCLF